MGHVFYFIKFVSDENDRLSPVEEIPQGCEQALDLLLRQDGRRFVQDEQLSITIEHLDDFHLLHLPDG